MDNKDRMSYKSFIFEVNPNIIEIKHSARVVSRAAPFGVDYVSNIGRRACEINGEGSFIGKGCMEQFSELGAKFLEGGTGLLLLPGLEPFYAYFESLKLLEEPSDELVRYSFSFVEDTAAEHFGESPKSVHTAAVGETLWDISYKYGTAVERLLECNPNIMRPDTKFDGGEVIRLC